MTDSLILPKRLQPLVFIYYLIIEVHIFSLINRCDRIYLKFGIFYDIFLDGYMDSLVKIDR